MSEAFSELNNQMENMNLETIYNEGIKEKLEELIDYDIYNKYGALIARGDLEFDVNLLEDITSLVKAISSVKRGVSSTLEW